ncbi:hypothetical protein [Chryseobacterium luquanense]|uniref:Uncharacterized protein n=1 Tax=Chryseobacterium luquanense TaxID=2983766 RepID=A0ABT3XZV8_9FLAO|nr:hypothetical protein [Chryseobacterium luquanense]MCX8531394.1 hypothetical protein [Chryseobacterium luquanense]
MSIVRITKGEYITEIEKGWTVYTDEFEAYAGQFSHFTAANGTSFGNPEKDEAKETKYFKDAWWSSDLEGKQRIVEGNVGQKVYFHIETQNIPDKDTKTGFDSEISIQLYDYDEDKFHDPISVIASNKARIVSMKVEKNKAVLDLLLSPGLEIVEEIEKDDDVRLFFNCTYHEDIEIPLPKEKPDYLLVKTCDKKVIQSYESIGYGRCEFYQYRYNDFMRRHEKCGHVPPDYYYGPMIKINEDTEKFYDYYALNNEMKNPVGMTVARIKTEDRLGVDGKPLVGYSYGFKYCVRFTHVLNPKLSDQGKNWLTKARFDLQKLMEIGLIKYQYEAIYDKITESMESTFNKNFEPTTEEVIAAGNGGKEKAKESKKEKYYKNIELFNQRFQEFAFATHPDVYNPKAMSELPLKDLALISLSPDFKEWMGEGAYGTWMQAAIVAGNMDYRELLVTNMEHYSQPENSGWMDAWEVAKEAGGKIKDEVVDIMLLDDIEKFIRENRITHD